VLEVPAHWDTLAACCRCLPCAMPADDALANREVSHVDQTCKEAIRMPCREVRDRRKQGHRGKLDTTKRCAQRYPPPASSVGDRIGSPGLRVHVGMILVARTMPRSI
jgi:hypothetical protein